MVIYLGIGDLSVYVQAISFFDTVMIYQLQMNRNLNRQSSMYPKGKSHCSHPVKFNFLILFTITLRTVYLIGRQFWV